MNQYQQDHGNAPEQVKGRFLVFVIILILMFAYLFVGLVNLQLKSSEGYSTKTESTRLKTIPLTGKRGNITDANSVILATDEMVYNVTFYKDASESSSSVYKTYTQSIIDTLKIIERILEDPEQSMLTAEELESLIHGRLIKKLPELELAVDGFITPEQKIKLKIIKEHFDALTLCKKHLEETILELAQPYQNEIQLIQTSPGFKNELSAVALISEIGVDMSEFHSSKHLCSWAGLAPTNNESAGKKKSVRISKAGCYLKPLLVQIANAVVKSTKYPEIRNKYLNIKKRRGHKKAIIAIARKLLTAIYHMLKNQEVYQAQLFSDMIDIPTSREITTEQALKLIKRQGYKITSVI